jgi:hypothetical protein
MADISGNIRASKIALGNQLANIANDANSQRMAALSSLVNDLNITMNENVRLKLSQINHFRLPTKFSPNRQTLKLNSTISRDSKKSCPIWLAE